MYVSILIPAFNASEFIRETIASCLEQGERCVKEVIIVDDHSTDETWDIINSYTDKRIRKYRNDINLGEYVNRIKAIGLAKGEYLIFIDGDDMIYPHGLSHMTRMLHSYPDCGMALMKPPKKWLFYPIVLSPRQFYLSNYFDKSFNNLSFTSTLFRTKIIQRKEYQITDFRSGDTYMRLMIAKDFNTLVIQNQLTWWRITPNQASQKIKNSASGVTESFELNKKVLYKSTELFTPEERKQALDNLLFSIRMQLRGFIRRRKFKKIYFIILYLSRKHLIWHTLVAKRTKKNVFSEYSSAQPLSNKAEIIKFS